mmetsp:Transcript_7420/g.21094  ORF Transcript_7420/g.21094 Transcript_7420/m.21094 type:complete len:252 (-) Transcript_7420:100-855(-)
MTGLLFRDALVNDVREFTRGILAHCHEILPAQHRDGRLFGLLRDLARPHDNRLHVRQVLEHHQELLELHRVLAEDNLRFRVIHNVGRRLRSVGRVNTRRLGARRDRTEVSEEPLGAIEPNDADTPVLGETQFHHGTGNLEGLLVKLLPGPRLGKVARDHGRLIGKGLTRELELRHHRGGRKGGNPFFRTQNLGLVLWVDPPVTGPFAPVWNFVFRLLRVILHVFLVQRFRELRIVLVCRRCPRGPGNTQQW